jgi:seryl-tRNA synthetase
MDKSLTSQPLTDQLASSAALIPTGAQGVFGRGENFSFATEHLSRAIHRAFGRGAERMQFPPVSSRADLERIGYFRNFPHLLGTVHCFCGDERTHRDLAKAHDAGEDWTSAQAASDLVLTPAACYPVYPALAARGVTPGQGYLVEVQSYCFRREPSADPARMQAFQMLEFVRVGTPEQARQFREGWIDKGQAFFAALGLPALVEAANDPFFGRAAGVMGQGQRNQELKFELKARVNEDGPATACMSFNLHLDHFGKALDLRTADGAFAHTACIGFGLERVALALFRRHGVDPARWPADVLDLLED